MKVIKASNYSDFQSQMNYINRIERDELEGREIAKGTPKAGVQEMPLSELRKKHPNFILPPIEVGISSTQDPHLDYHCPYCNVVLNDNGDSLSCKYCPGNKTWKK